MNKNPYWLKAIRGICLPRRTEILETGILMCFTDYHFSINLEKGTVWVRVYGSVLCMTCRVNVFNFL